MLLRGLLLKRTGSRPYTHSILEMLKSLAESYSVELNEDLIVCGSRLEKHYLMSRYPDVSFSDYAPWEAEEALACLRKVVEYVRKLGEDF